MREETKKRCDLLVENWGILHKTYFLENGLLTAVTASVYADKDQRADIEAYKEANKILKKNQGCFSDFRGNNEMMVSAKMALSGDPEGYVEDVATVYKKLQSGKFWNSTYRALAAMVIVDAGKTNDADAIIEKTHEIMKGMQKDHPFLTSDEDTCFAVLLAMTDKSTEAILTELEESFQYIKKDFSFHQNAAYSMSQVLTTYPGDAQSKKDKALDLLAAFDAAGSKYGKDYELASVGSLVTIDMSTEEIVSEIVEIADYLKAHTGFGSLSMSKATRLMFGTLIVSQLYVKDDSAADTSVISGAVARVIAEQTAMYVAMIACYSGAISASSSN